MNRESHRSAGIVLYRPGPPRRYLLLRSALTRRPVWEFPKGAVEAGESLQEAAERELQEETGLGAGDYTSQQGFREEERYFFTRGRGVDRRLIKKHVTYFIAEWHSGQVTVSREASRYEWATTEEAQRLLRFPEKRRVLAAADVWLNERVLTPPAESPQG